MITIRTWNKRFNMNHGSKEAAALCWLHHYGKSLREVQGGGASQIRVSHWLFWVGKARSSVPDQGAKRLRSEEKLDIHFASGSNVAHYSIDVEELFSASYFQDTKRTKEPERDPKSAQVGIRAISSARRGQILLYHNRRHIGAYKTSFALRPFECSLDSK